MTKATLKTAQNQRSPTEFIAGVEHPQRKKDAEVLLALFQRVTGLQAYMWGSSIIGYGRYHYRYESGQEGEYFITGFSPRKSNLTIYVMPGYQDLSSYLQRLGKHKTGKSCLYINKLSDIDLEVLEEIILYGLNYMREHYPSFDA